MLDIFIEPIFDDGGSVSDAVGLLSRLFYRWKKHTPTRLKLSSRFVAPIDRAKNETGFPGARGIVGNV